MRARCASLPRRIRLTMTRDGGRDRHDAVGALVTVLAETARRIAGPALGQGFRRVAPTAVLMAVSVVLALGFTQVALRIDTISSSVASNVGTELPGSIQLAQAFTAAVDAHDVDALVEL